ncbi:hypothetical protein DY000_02053552 [Brassica cretica]|uniref:Uncharacterized protein n=1 Tax=Brassica cretica TaxID=69181 RepID=A0ABQ7AJD0_BRACR|nr:hypothetical protein DY000_02053552 [Brassica cretica]
MGVRNDMAVFGRYIAARSALDRSLRSDRTGGLVVRYVATDSFAGRSLRSDRLVRGLVVTWRPCLDPFLTFYERVLGLWVFSFDESTETSERFHRKVLCEDFFTNITFRKSVHADFYGYWDVNFVMSVFDPNKASS